MNDFIFDIEFDYFKGFKWWNVYFGPRDFGQRVHFGAYVTKRDAERIVEHLSHLNNETLQIIYDNMRELESSNNEK